MKYLIRLFVSLLVPALMLAFATAAPAMKHEMAQDKAKDAKAAPAVKAEKGKPTRKEILENAKVKVYVVTYKPGDSNSAIATTKTRVVRVLRGSKTEWTFADGKKQIHDRKAGDVWVADPGPGYTNKNIGKTAYEVYVVELK